MNEIEKKNQKKPEKIVRNGAVAASIWLRQVPTALLSSIYHWIDWSKDHQLLIISKPLQSD